MAVGTITLASIRPQAAEALAPVLDSDPYVHEDIVDSVTPSALMLGWDDPWLEPSTAGLPSMGGCIYTARLRIVCVAARLDPGSGVDELERLVTYVLDRMAVDAYVWPLDTVTAPRQTDQSGISSLVADVFYAVPTSI